jgi:hypothetical protein
MRLGLIAIAEQKPIGERMSLDAVLAETGWLPSRSEFRGSALMVGTSPKSPHEQSRWCGGR